jgi:trehalose-6-phosphate synthase
MRLSLRFIIPLLVALILIAYGLTPLIDRLTLQWFVRDLDIRTELITSAVSQSLAPLLKDNARTKILLLFNRLIKDERLYALGFCDSTLKLPYKTQTFPEQISCEQLAKTVGGKSLLQFPQGPLHVAFRPISDDEQNILGHLILIHDMSFVQRRSGVTKQYVVYLFIGLGVVISLITVVIAQLSWKGWIAGMRSILRGEGLFHNDPPSVSPEMRPLVQDIRALIEDLEADRRARDENQISWNPRALKDLLHRKLAGEEILIVSNREPYIHNRMNGAITVQLPASGLVTALEPVMRACSGTWIAHGSGSADRDVVDAYDRVKVPPDAPTYQLRRLWLTPEEERGYYYGFANEGLWPLCHIAHVRPSFRSDDWKHYAAVNRKFAGAVVEEAKTANPVVLVQDYHFSLLPKLIREALPQATIIMFWHIPWPNPEAFGICPWRAELIEGLLGSSILGFHTRFHCNNFIDSVDRFIESRIDREHSTISYGGKLTAVNAYPISVEWSSRWIQRQKPVDQCRAHVRELLRLPAGQLLGLGVDRLDYTKGLLERLLAIERLLERHPQWRGTFSFVQIAAPSRTSIPHYKQFETDVRALAQTINAKFSQGGYEPIILKVEHHDPDRVYEYYRGADLCFVSSLHDGINLVAKELIAAREDERGVLILSQFTGASRELPEALIVNPYDTDQCAEALHLALSMPASEQRDRMRNMRGLIQEFNVYRWAGRMLLDAARIREQDRFLERTRTRSRLGFGISSSA